MNSKTCKIWSPSLMQKKLSSVFLFHTFAIPCFSALHTFKVASFYGKTWRAWIYHFLPKSLASLERNFTNFLYISFLCVNFENLTVEFHVPYVLNMYIKFHSNWILFIIRLINLFFIYNFRSKKFEISTFVWRDNNWSLIFLKFYMHEEYNKNMQSNG